jgi:hypothetical protein
VQLAPEDFPVAALGADPRVIKTMQPRCSIFQG